MVFQRRHMLLNGRRRYSCRGPYPDSSGFSKEKSILSPRSLRSQRQILHSGYRGFMSEEILESPSGQLAVIMGKRAENLYLTGQLLCSEAVLAVMNRGLRGGLPEGMDIRLASALPLGLGNSGCTCGALSGAALALGLFLGRNRPGALNGKPAMPSANLLHSRFKGLFGSTCCRVLTQKVKHSQREHFKQCANITGQTAELAALILLEKRPELADSADLGYLEAMDSWLGSKFRQLAGIAGR
jgi:C_GCAxxG_C_C family probable redox protein